MLKSWLGRTVTKGAIVSAVGSLIASQWVRKSRKQWEDAAQSDAETFLNTLTSYETARGAGRLLAGWLVFSKPKASLTQHEQRLKALLPLLDAEDNRAEDLALSRILISKALFHLEGFRLSGCRYEVYQKMAQAELRKNPNYRNISRNQIFKVNLYDPETLIGATHRLLLTVDDGRLPTYLNHFLEKAPLRDDSDYIARLIALTLGKEEKALTATVEEWFGEYRNFKIDQSHQREAWMNTSMAAVSGELPAMTGMDLLGRAWKRITKRKKQS